MPHQLCTASLGRMQGYQLPGVNAQGAGPCSTNLHLTHPVLARTGLTHRHAQALEFVRDLDSGPLSQCPTGARHFAALRKATKSMINSVLQLRQLIQRRRGPNPGDTPRPLPRNESFSSFTESTASGRQPFANSAASNGQAWLIVTRDM